MALGAPDSSHSSPTSRNTFLPVSSEPSALVPPRTSATNYSGSSFAVTLGPGDPPTRTHSTPPVRTLPPWVRSFEVCEDDPDATARLLPAEIEDALVAQHNHSPYATSKSNRSKSAEAGNEPYYTDQEIRESRWRRFVQISAYPHAEVVAEEKRVSFEWLNNNMGDYSQPWGARRDGSDTEMGRITLRSKQRNLWTRFQRHLLSSPTVPLIFRLTVWIFSLCALSLGGSIRALSGRFDRYPGPSADMAIVVDAVALVYLVYITYDEYTSKPLGLRPPNAKMRLILLDIFFIIFDAANMTLAFVSLHDVQGTCTSAVINDVHDDRNDTLCVRQKALASVLLVALIAWLLTFCISIFRLVERVSN